MAGSHTNTPLVGLIMGSQSDWPTLQLSANMLSELNISFETRIISAHRTPDRLYTYSKTAEERGLEVIIAGAGGAAHLPGMVAALTVLPVLGVPIKSANLSGLDSLLSIVQMPKGVPVGTLAIGDSGAKNAGLLAGKILSIKYPNIRTAIREFQQNQTDTVAISPDHAP